MFGENMKVDIKLIPGTKDYKVFGNGEFVGYVNITPEGKWLYNPHWEITLKSKVFNSYNELYDWLVWSDY